MEAVGVAGSAVTLADVTFSLSKKTIQTLKSVQNAPEELRTLMKEIQGFRDVLDSVRELVIQGNSITHLPDTLEQSRSLLLELDCLIHYRLSKPGEFFEAKPVSWAVHKKKAFEKVEEVRNITQNLTTFKYVADYKATRRLETNFEQLSSTLTDSHASNQEILKEVSQYVSAFEGLIEGTESSTEKKKLLATLLCTNRTTFQGTTTPRKMNSSSNTIRHHCENESAGNSPSKVEYRASERESPKPLQPWHSDGQASFCQNYCGCRCHRHKPINLPPYASKWACSLRLLWGNLGWFAPSCNVSKCKRSATRYIHAQYKFRLWMASTLICAWYNCTPAGDPKFFLTTINVVESDAFDFAGQGQLEQLRSAYQNGMASTHDAEPKFGYTALMIEISHRQIEVIRFLLSVGADPGQRSFSGYSANDHALEAIYSTIWDTETREEMRVLFETEDIMGDQDLTSLHRILLGHSRHSDLEDEVEKHPELANRMDRWGRTPLHVAVWLEDVDAVRTLLYYGAEVGFRNAEGISVFHACAKTGSDEIMQLLLESAPTQDEGLRCSYLNDPSIYGTPPCLEAAVGGNVDVLRTLVRYGCDLSAKDIDGDNIVHYACLPHQGSEMALLLIGLDLSSVDLLSENENGDSALDVVYDRVDEEYSAIQSEDGNQEEFEIWSTLLQYLESLVDNHEE